MHGRHVHQRLSCGRSIQSLGPRSKLGRDAEYTSSVTLIILGTALDPQEVSRALRLRPAQSWKRGDTRGKSAYDWGGWKKFLPASQESRPLASQLRYWARTLKGLSKPLSKLTNAGHICMLDCFIGTDATASIVIPSDLQSELAALGLEIRLSVWAGP